MDKLLYLSNKYMPSINTLAYKLLATLADGLPRSTQELISALGTDPRSPLQALKNDSHGFWLIHNTGSPKGIYQLDKRHLSGDRELDIKARTERELEYLRETRKIAEAETIRLPKAIMEEAEAKLRLQKSFSFYHPKVKKSSLDNNPEQIEARIVRAG